ncbi:hypothetical protein [Vibrio tasmaniensis]|uniref:hypothetical protein n=1 Tax=Vibrio tasmaniensis TaxID=212663 RepID=UPI00107FB888|nr:hypothetical protein [Vibrio tasmaniensis]
MVHIDHLKDVDSLEITWGERHYLDHTFPLDLTQFFNLADLINSKNDEVENELHEVQMWKSVKNRSNRRFERSLLQLHEVIFQNNITEPLILLVLSHQNAHEVVLTA